MAEQEALRKKLQKRNGHRLVVRKTITKVNELLSPIEENRAATPAVTVKLESLRNTLDTKRTTIGQIDNEIEELLDETDIEKEIVDRSAFEEELEDTICKITAVLTRKETQNVNAVNPRPSGNSVKVKLPKLSLPHFNGNPTQWTTFWDSFQSTIHSNVDLSNVDKLKYLQTSLSGEAAQTISGLQITNDNYEEAIELLEKRFGNKQIIISRHIEDLMQLSRVSSNEDLRGLRLLYDKMETVTRSLKSIGVKSESYSAVLSPVIMSKLPSELRLFISRRLGEEWDVVGLLEQLGEEISLREKCVLSSIGHTTRHAEKEWHGNRLNQNQSYRKQLPTASTLVVENRMPHVPNCLFCNSKHFSASCTKVTDPNARKKILRDLRRCFVCLRAGHINRDCNSRSRCFHCQGRHHSSICGSPPENPQAPSAIRPPQTVPQSTAPNAQVSTNLYISQDLNNHATLLQTAKAEVHKVDNPSEKCNVRVILDSCSQKSYITTRLRDRLNLHSVTSNKVLIKEFGNDKGTLRSCDSVQLAIKGADNLTVYINAFVVPLICSPLSNQVINVAQDMYPHLRNLPLADCGDGSVDLEVDVMIGAGYVHNFLLDYVVRGEQPLSPVAILTRFGFVLSGPVQIPAHNTCSSNVTVAHVLKIGAIIQESSSGVNEQLKTFWELENLGVKDDKTQVEVENLMKDKIMFDGERYRVSLPVKDQQSVIPDNYVLAKKRLMSLLHRLKSKPGVFKQYSDVIQEQLASGVVEYANDDEISAGTTHYIPHSSVIKEDRQTTKLRVVYDASSKVAGEISLNECLHPGPNLLPLIFNVLLRFRMNKIALIGDLEKAFLQISINPDQRDLLRFLWFDDSDLENARIVKLRFTRLAFGLTCSPYILNSTIRHHLEGCQNSDPEFTKNVINSLYVDDYASSFNSESEAFEMYRKLKETFKNGGFNMRKWGSNCTKLLDKIESAENLYQDRAQNSRTSIESNKSNVTKVLGVPWDQSSDKLSLDLSVITNDATPERVTKRLILSTIARFYDPLGLLSPVIVPLKQIFQEICKLKTNWDVQLPKDVCHRWCELMVDIKRKTLITIDRCVLSEISFGDIKVIELHGFADASNVAYGGVVYVRVVTHQVTIVRLIAAKSKLAPLKGETTPRLELKASLVLAQLIISVKTAIQDCHKIENIFCWSDSNVVLYWIYTDYKKQKEFVENRLIQIRNHG